MRHATFMLFLGGTLLLLAAAFAGSTQSANAPTAPTLTFNPTSWAAPTTTVGSQSTSSAYTVTFSGRGNSGPLSFGISGGGTPFMTSGTDDTCTGATLSPKNPTCTFKIIFAPPSATAYSSTLYVYGRKLSASASLTGTGHAVTLPSLSISDNPLTYYNSTNNIARFTVTMSAVASSAVTFNWAATDDTAVWGTTCDGTVDYTSASNTGTGTIAAGATTTTIAFGTCINAPGYHYPWTPTYFTVTISNPTGATITDDTGAGTIRTS